MPQTCRACKSPERAGIDKALAIGTPLRDIAGRYGVSRSALDRHKSHVVLSITKIQEKREIKIGDGILEGIEQLKEKAIELLGKMEQAGDYRGAVLAVREAREALESASEIATRVSALASSTCRVTVSFIGEE